MLSDRVRGDEYNFTKEAMDALQSVPWAVPLIRVAQARDLLEPENKPLMFEVRFAFELHRAGVVAQYEYSTGMGGSSVDFRILGTPEWLIEIVSIRASKAVQQTTHQKDISYTGYGNDPSKIHTIKWHTFQMSTDDPNCRQRPEGELITAEQKIGEKVRAKNGSPTKFPPPNGTMHLILIDMRGYLGGGGHKNAYRQIAYGARDHIVQREWVGEYREVSPGKREPVIGLFEACNPLPAARLIQERIHFLGFINERQYRGGEIRSLDPNSVYYLANPHLFSTEDEAEEAFGSYPLRLMSTVL